MSEPWKVLVCGSEACLSEVLGKDGSVKEEYKIYPEIDTPELTQFRCTRCGQIEKWGPTRQEVARILYERINRGGNK